MGLLLAFIAISLLLAVTPGPDMALVTKNALAHGPRGVLLTTTGIAFALVSIGVLVLRKTDPDRPRPFRVKWVYVVAPVSAILCLLVMLGLPGETWIRFAVWLVIGLSLYAFYGHRHSRLRQVSPSTPGGP